MCEWVWGNGTKVMHNASQVGWKVGCYFNVRSVGGNGGLPIYEMVGRRIGCRGGYAVYKVEA